jgi:ElaB/YqjD/DUF883 family membrane-anchored ribosome-binding protein
MGSTSMGSTRHDGESTKPAGEQVGQMANDIAQQAGQVKDQVKEQVTQQAGAKVDEQKQRAATQLSSLAMTLSDATSSLGDQNPQLAHFADTAVDRLNQWSTQLENKDFSELVDDVERFARRNPAVFVGGAFALGLLASRFLKSSAPESNLSRQYQYSSRPSYSTYDYTGSGRSSSYRPGVERQGAWSGAERQGYSTPLRDTAGYGMGARRDRAAGMTSPTDTEARGYPRTGAAGDAASRGYPETGGMTDTSTRDYSGTSSTTDAE